jgi:hypothetical protein
MMRTSALLGVVVLLWLATAHAQSSDQTLLLAQGQAAIVYTENLFKSTSIPLVFAGVNDAVHDVKLWSRGQPRSLRVGGTTGITIGADAANPLGPRWRYQTLSNFSLTLSNTPRAWHTRTRVTTFYCQPSSPYFCDLGDFNFSLGGRDAVYDVVVDLTRQRGLLPPLLFDTIAKRGICVDTAGLLLCPADIPPHFGMGNDSTIASIGATFWRSRYAQFEIDGWTGIIRAASANPIPEGLQTAGLIIGFFVLLFLYGLAFATNPDAASYSNEFGPAPREPGINKRISIGSWSAVPVAIVAGILAWVAATRYGPPDAALLGPQLETFLILLTVFAGAQLVLLVVLIILDEFNSARSGREWNYPTTRSRMWLRCVALGTSAAAIAAIFFFPAVLDADAGGDRMILYILLIPLGLTVIHGIYHLPGLFIFAENAGDYAGAVFELLLALGWLASIYWFYLAPTISVSSAYFNTAIDFLAATLLYALVAALSIVLVIFEVAVAVTTAREEEKKRL